MASDKSVVPATQRPEVEEWETVDGVTRRKRKPSLFWDIFMAVNLIVIVALVGTLTWAVFDMHERIGWLWIALVPAIVMMVIRRCFR